MQCSLSAMQSTPPQPEAGHCLPSCHIELCGHTQTSITTFSHQCLLQRGRRVGSNKAGIIKQTAALLKWCCGEQACRAELYRNIGSFGHRSSDLTDLSPAKPARVGLEITEESNTKHKQGARKSQRNREKWTTFSGGPFFIHLFALVQVG